MKVRRLVAGGALAAGLAAAAYVATRPPAPAPAGVPVNPAPPVARDGRRPDPVETLLRDYVRLQEIGAAPERLQAAEREIEGRLLYLDPNGTVDLLLARPAQAAGALLLRGVDNGLARDREGWEAALAAGLDRAPDDGFASVALERIRDGRRRGRAVLRLARGAPAGGTLLFLAARNAPAESAAELRDLLWSRVPEKAAVEGLGYLVGPEEATRLESLGPGLEVRRALEIALERTGDPAFRDSLRRLGR